MKSQFNPVWRIFSRHTSPTGVIQNLLCFTVKYTLLLLALISWLPQAQAYTSQQTVMPKSQVMEMVFREAEVQGVDPALALAVAETESGFRSHVESHAGARGVMQIMPRTSRDVFGVSPARLFDPATNIRLGVSFLAQLLDTYGRTDIALSHYNGGSAVRDHHGNLRVIPATRGYVAKVLNRAGQYRRDPQYLAMARSDINHRMAVVSADLDDNPYAATVTVARDRNQLVLKLKSLQRTIRDRFDLGDDLYQVSALYQTQVNQTSYGTAHDARVARVRQWESFR